LETGGCCGSVVLECAKCSLHATVEGALSETVATVSLSTVPRLSPLSGSPVVYEWGSGCMGEGGRITPIDLAVRSHRDQMMLRK